jgi:hypothetical protein
MVNAILTFCAEVDPRNAQSFLAEWKTAEPSLGYAKCG